MGTSWTKGLDEDDAKCIRECPNPPHPSGCDTENAFKAEEHCKILEDTNRAFKVILYLHVINIRKKYIFYVKYCFKDIVTLNQNI